jgi:hypothetical protein
MKTWSVNGEATSARMVPRVEVVGDGTMREGVADISALIGGSKRV